jgi:hypothetical protein
MYSKTPALLPIPGINWRNQTVITRNPAPSYAESGTRVKLSHGDFAGASTVEASVSLRSSLSYSMIRTQNEAALFSCGAVGRVLYQRCDTRYKGTVPRRGDCSLYGRAINANGRRRSVPETEHKSTSRLLVMQPMLADSRVAWQQPARLQRPPPPTPPWCLR